MIFVSIAAYQEPLLAQTIADACRKAERPRELVFGVVDQHPHSRRQELQALHPELQLRYVHLHPLDARGVCWARSICFSLYRGEDHLLQIDSHMIFEMSWDERLRLQLERLQALAQKPVVTNYPWGFEMKGRTPVVNPQRAHEATLYLKPHPDCVLSPSSATLRFVTDQLITDEPVKSCHIAAGFFFTSGRFVEEVPYDPQLYFHGEEQSLALRAYTKGWDIFHLREIPLYHQYKTAGEENESLHWHNRWNALRDIDHTQATRHADERLMDLVYRRRDLGVYGLGSVRILEDYAEEFGIDYPARSIRQRPGLPGTPAATALPAGGSDSAGTPRLQQQAAAPLDALSADVFAVDDLPFDLSVVEINPYHPRPFVFSDGARSITASLQDLGIHARHLVNRIPSRGGAVVLGWTPQWLAANRGSLDRNRTFLFNAEQLGSGSPILTAEYLQALGEWKVMDYHEANADYIGRLHGARAQVTTIPIIPGPAVCYDVPSSPPEAEACVDVLFFGTMNPRRQTVIDELRSRGLTVEVVSGSYGAELAPALKRCRLVLHVHFYNLALFPILRVLQPVARGVPVVCESSVFSKWNDWSSSGMVFAGYEHLGQACEELAKDPDRATTVARRCLDFATSLEMTEV